MTFRVARIGAGGAVLFDRRIPYQPQPLTQTHRDSAIAEAARRFADSRFAGTDIRAMMAEGMFLPPLLPPVTTLLAARDGTTWIERERIDPVRSRWEVLDVRGVVVATVTTPRIFRAMYADSLGLWGTEAVGTDRLAVVRYRVAR